MDSGKDLDLIFDNPIIASVKRKEDIRTCVNSKASLSFIIFGNLLDIASLVNPIKESGKTVIVPIDLIDGLSAHDAAVDYIVKKTKADGIISTKANILRTAKSRGLLTVQRFFMLDSRAMDMIVRQIDSPFVDIIEIVPGAMPKMLKKVVEATDKPIIAGGCILDREDIMTALNAGATAVSTSNSALWNL